MNDDTLHDEAGGRRPVVYVRLVRRDELPAEAPPMTLWSIHDETGARIGVAPRRDLAFEAARSHEFAPVSAH